jgi:DNA-binding protein HU-beta
MNQGDLADAVAAATGAEKAEAARVVGALLDAIRNGLKRGEGVAIRGFGECEAARRGPRKGRNPRTGEAVEVAPMTLVRFRPGKRLKDALNGGAAPAARSSR